MLTINKDISFQRLLVTQSEINSITTGCTLNLFNKITNVSSTISLPNDSSQYPTRYNEYVIATSVFSGLSNGIYSFEIKKGDEVVEAGLIKVTDNVLTQQEELTNNYILIPSTSTDDDFIVFGG